MNRGTGDAVAEGHVKTTYSDLRERPNGALLAGASPIHVTARTMTAHRDSATATYTGDVRLWQDANVVEAANIDFDRDRRSIVARGNGRPVSTALVQLDKNGKVTPITITSTSPDLHRRRAPRPVRGGRDHAGSRRHRDCRSCRRLSLPAKPKCSDPELERPGTTRPAGGSGECCSSRTGTKGDRGPADLHRGGRQVRFERRNA